jgi:hypothetical protein
MADQFFEMLWDCEQCDARELLAKSQRHCPMCGAAQDPKRRYFPEPGREVEAQGHRFVGVDWACAYCESPNSAAAAFCINCGGPKEGAKDVARVQDMSQPAAEPNQRDATPLVTPALAPATSKPEGFTQPQVGTRSSTSGFPWLAAIPAVILALILIAVSVLVYSFFSKHDESVQLVEKTWNRSVSVEHFTAVKTSNWCDAMPADAYQVARTREQRSTRQIADGETCVESRADMGDGTFTKRRDCSPRYREEPVYDSRCSYRINRWQVLRTDTLGGGATLAPEWPNPVLGNTWAPGNSLGAERLGPRSEDYRVRVQNAKGKDWTCPLPQEAWTTLAEKQAMTIKVRGTGGADCDSLMRSD